MSRTSQPAGALKKVRWRILISMGFARNLNFRCQAPTEFLALCASRSGSLRRQTVGACLQAIPLESPSADRLQAGSYNRRKPRIRFRQHVLKTRSRRPSQPDTFPSSPMSMMLDTCKACITASVHGLHPDITSLVSENFDWIEHCSPLVHYGHRNHAGRHRRRSPHPSRFFPPGVDAGKPPGCGDDRNDTDNPAPFSAANQADAIERPGGRWLLRFRRATEPSARGT